MSTLLWSIGVAAVLSVTSLFTILLRVSPLSAPEQAIPTFFLSLFLAVGSVGSLLCLALWRALPHHTLDRGTELTIALREGILLGLLISVLTLFQILGILSLWIGLLIVAIFLLVEVAMHV
jgi:cobalamin synthase